MAMADETRKPTTTDAGTPVPSDDHSLTVGSARDRLVFNVVGHLSDGVSEPVLERAFEYWRNIDKETGDLIAKGVHGG
jgi:catalase